MTDPDDHHHLDVNHEGRLVCSADVTVDNSELLVRVSLHSESGHMPPGSRSELVDDILALPDVQHASRLAAAVPRGDSESLHRLQERCTYITTHMAGATVIVDADLTTDNPHAH
jgi:hypothetical protein